MECLNCKKRKKNGVDGYSDRSYHLWASFGWIGYHGVEGSKFPVVDGTY